MMAIVSRPHGDSGGFSLRAAADALAITTRALQRRCDAVLGKSPLAWFQGLRVERAQSLIHGSGLGIEAIAAEVGYNDSATLRMLLRRRLGVGCASCGPSCVSCPARFLSARRQAQAIPSAIGGGRFTIPGHGGREWR
jgi:AraC-like DNA-binding protein